MPTVRGRIMLAASVALYAAARTLSIDELYALATAAAAFPLAAMAFVRFGRHRVTIARTVTPQRVFAGGRLRIQLVAHNKGRAPSPPLLLEDPAPRAIGGPVRVAMPPLRPGRSETMTADRKAVARGRYPLGPLRARVLDPFGLAERGADMAPGGAVVVFPAVEALHEVSPPDARGGAGQTSLFRIATQGDEFYAVRGWQDGDDLRKIHWRSSARRGELMIRQDEVRPFPRATVFVDTRAPGHRDGPSGSSFEWSLSVSASILWELARQGFALRLATADEGPAGSRAGREATDPLLTTLALASPSTNPSLGPAIKRLGARPGAEGILLAVMPPPTEDALPRLARIARPYAWSGAVLVDSASFAKPSPRERAVFDQRLAAAERALARAGWRVIVAGSDDKARTVWETLTGAAGSRQRSSSLRSS